MKRSFGIGLVLIMLCSGLVALPAAAAEPSDDPAWTIYARPGVRFGTDDRTLFIMDFIVPLYDGEKNLLFFNPRYTLGDGDGWETNLGLGYRHLLFDDKLILGANVYYDMRRTSWGSYHKQVGFGFEAMTELNKYVALTGRFNYYIPLTDPIVSGGGGGGGGGYVFRDEGIYTLGGGLVEESLEGFDGELGFRVPFVSDYVETWVYGGGYHYDGRYIDNVNGWTARLEIVPADFIRLNYEYRDDNTIHGEHFGQVMFEVPFSIGNLVAGKNPFEGFGDVLPGSRDMKARLNEQVRRDVDITVKTVATGGTGTEGELIEGVIFVSDDGNDTTGDGTYENPYSSIGYAMLNLGGYTIVHVMNRIGGVVGGPAPASVNVPGVTIWGSGVAHPDYPVISNFSPGTYPTVLEPIDVSGPSVTIMGLRVENYVNLNNSIGCVVRNNVLIRNSGSGTLTCSFNAGSSESSPLVIADNTIISTGNATSIIIPVQISGNEDVFARITGNHIEVTAGRLACAILISGGEDIGSAATPLVISGNDITTTVTGGLVSNMSIWAMSGGSVATGRTFAEITGNRFSNNGGTAYLRPSAILWLGPLNPPAMGHVGSISNPVVFRDNSGTISGNTTGRYLVYVQTGDPGGGNALDWGGIGTGPGQNDFTAAGGWGGYNGVFSPVYNENLNLGGGDFITPAP